MLTQTLRPQYTNTPIRRITPTALPTPTTIDTQRTSKQTGILNLDGRSYGRPQNDLPGITQLHLNENQFTAAQAATARVDSQVLLERFLANIHSYPTAGADQLLQTIAGHLQTRPEKLVIGNGSAELLRHILFYLLTPCDTLLVPGPSWSYYNAIAELVQAKVATFPLLDTGHAFFYDKFAIADQIDIERPKVVLLCSPNNPTGSLLPAADFAWLIHHYPQVNFILDEAYFGFCDAYTAEEAANLLKLTNRPNVFVIRTFSKFYGLANLRLGFAICNEENSQNLNKLAPVFGVPSISQALAAERLTDTQFETEMKEEYAAVSRYLHRALNQLPGLTPYETCANFVLVKHDDRWHNVERQLFDLGFMVKRQPINGATNYLRITLANLGTISLLISALHEAARNLLITS